ncbi:MAG: pyrroline-5-carboxylate reductase [Bacteroidales bacterium]|nr:pyrroline-5-carboxylate reductase [Bacteroidales bacterium]
MDFNTTIAIIGGGNIGMSIAEGLVNSGKYQPEQIIITRKKSDLPQDRREGGFYFQDDNADAVSKARIVVLSVVPHIFEMIMSGIKDSFTEKHTLINVVTGVDIAQIQKIINKDICIARAIPNTAIRIRQSMTCIATNKRNSPEFAEVVDIFDMLGKTLVLDEDLMLSATALGSCGIAYFLRTIRAASQGGTQIGFHADEAQLIAAQTAKGAAELLLQLNSHPEDEIDKVTTPRGITIAGLNEMEHNGLSSALIKGIVKSYDKAANKED